MVLVRLGALRFHGLIADFGSLPIDATLIGGIFDATDTVQKFVFDGSAWVEFVSGTGEDNTGANVGVGTGNVFRDKTGVTLNFKTLIGGTNIVVTDNADDITLSSTGTSPLTTKGDLFGFSTVDDRFPVGVDGQVIQADSAQALGVKYIDLLFTKGQLLTFDTGLTQLGVGTNDQVLTADSAIASGLKWADAAAGGGITGLNPDSTILEYLNTVSTVFDDYTTPQSATATSNGTLFFDAFVYVDQAAADLSWPTSNTTNMRVDQPTEVLNATSIGAEVATDVISHDLGVVLDSAEWIVQFKLTFTLQINTTGNAVNLAMGMGDNASNGATNQDFIGLVWLNAGSGLFRTLDTEGTAPNVAASDASFTFVPTQGAIVFARITRLSLTAYQVDLFSDSSFTTLIESQTGITTAGATGFQFIKIMSFDNAADGQITATIDDVSVFDTLNAAQFAIDGDTATFWKSDAGINEAITVDMGSLVNCYGLAYFLSTDAGLTETQFQIKNVPSGLLYSDNFTTDLWNDIGTGFGVNTGSQVLEYDMRRDTVSNGTSHDLGIEVSNTEWLLRFSINVNVLTVFGTSTNWGFIMVSDVDENSDSDVAQQFIGLRLRYDNVSGLSDDYSILSDNATNDPDGVVTDGDFTHALQLENIFIEIKRTSPTAYIIGLYNDANFTSLIEELTGTCDAEINNLRFIKFMGQTTTTSGGEISGVINNIEFFNDTIIPTDATPARILRTINLSDMTLDAWNFIRFNGVNTRQLTIEGSSGGTLIMSANELAVQIESDPPLITKHGQFTINGTDPNLPFNGGDPTSSVIDSPSVNSLTLVGTVTQNDPVPGASVMWTEPIDGSNDGIFAKIKVADVFATVQVAPIVASPSDKIESPDTNTDVVTSNGDITTRLSSVAVVNIAGTTIATELDLNIKDHFQDWAEMAVPSDPLSSQARMYQYVQDVNNSPMAVKMKVDGAVKIVRFF